MVITVAQKKIFNMKETRTRYTHIFMYIYKSGKLFTSNILIWKEGVIRGLICIIHFF